MKDKFIKLREEYPSFIYTGFDVTYDQEYMNISYHFEIPGLTSFNPVTKIPLGLVDLDNKDKSFINYLVFHVGLVELISYWKVTCSPKVIIKAGYLNEEQVNWFRKLYFNGLGEFFYINEIDTNIDSFMDIEISRSEEVEFNTSYLGSGNLIAVGGGKDSIVSLELLKEFDNNTVFSINPKEVMVLATDLAGYNPDHFLGITRLIDKELLRLNQEGFLNGHTPFSAIVAFLSYLTAYLTNKRYIVLSNESSANEATVLNTNINHQYSKTYEFENDFNNYTNNYFKIEIKYFSLLRPLSELQIAMIFSEYKKYHSVFRSCNVGSKNDDWVWCCSCPKCLFVYLILAPFLSRDELINIFGTDLFDNKDLLNTYLELLGYSDTKPFECVGTYSESLVATSLTINKYLKNNIKLPYLLDYYYQNFPLVEDFNYLLNYNEENNLDSQFIKIVKEKLDDVSKYYSEIN